MNRWHPARVGEIYFGIEWWVSDELVEGTALDSDAGVLEEGCVGHVHGNLISVSRAIGNTRSVGFWRTFQKNSSRILHIF